MDQALVYKYLLVANLLAAAIYYMMVNTPVGANIRRVNSQTVQQSKQHSSVEPETAAPPPPPPLPLQQPPPPPPDIPPRNWLKNLANKGCKFSKFSQGHQDGTLFCIFNNIQTTNKYFVEFGFNLKHMTKKQRAGSGPNTQYLWAHGWQGLYLDISNENPAINLHAETLTSESIGPIFDKYKVPMEPDFVSVDIDSCDLWVFRGLLVYGYRPRVMTCEYNANHKIESSLTTPNWPSGVRFQERGYFGTSLGAITMVAHEFGYALVQVVPQLDAVFVRRDLLRGLQEPPLSRWNTAKYITQTWPAQSIEELNSWIDYADWRSTHQHNDTRITLHRNESVFVPEARVRSLLVTGR
eukprot:TRINITY_DN32003_c0_g1_i1.p1 TRINITY_DN32003_c0_g1~~TRINITY_DN32003_c0_g1_i1.p1  ORF type:complete len:353 (-),score=35.40 TRINITY_DN32003_c0_g1_i1:118-1176(-)